MTTEETLARLEALCEQYPGPYTISAGNYEHGLPYMAGLSKGMCFVREPEPLWAVVDAYTALPALLAAVRAAHAYCRATQADPLAHVRQVGAYNAMATALRALGEGAG